MVGEEPVIIFREIYKCSNCGTIVDPLAVECPSCPAKFTATSDGIKGGIIVENIDEDILGKGRVWGTGPTQRLQYGSVSRDYRPRNEKGTDRYNVTRQHFKQVKPQADYAGLAVSLDKFREKEFHMFNRALTSIARDESMGVLLDTFRSNIEALIIGAGVAKFQMDEAEFGGKSPYAGQFGMTQISPLMFGKSTWLLDENEIYSTKNIHWIHSGSEGYEGTTGNGVRILDNVVMVILGFGDMLSLTEEKTSPISSFTYVIDNKTMPSADVSTSFPTMDFPFTSLDTAILLSNKSYFRASCNLQPSGEGKKIAPFIYGFAFCMEYAMRDNANLHKSTQVNKVSEAT